MKKVLRTAILSVIFACILSLGHLYGQSGIFDRTGIVPGHGAYSSLPEERVDLFTGNLTLSYRDIFLPGPNGLNIEVWRVYNSKILQDRLTSQPSPTVQAYPKSMVGIGWSMHMGMVHNCTSNTPVIEFTDGRRETAYPPKSEYGYGSRIRITRDFLMFDKGIPGLIDPRLYFQNGAVWTFGNIASLPLANGSSETVYMVTRIEDPLGNFIEIEYDAQDSLRSIATITDSMEREIRFVKTYQGSNPAKLVEIRIRNYDDSHDVVYSYSVGSFSNGYYKLLSFTPPLLPAATYDYNDGLTNNYELTRVTTSFGGILEYSYVNHDFYFNTTRLDSKVVSQKRITFNPGEQAKVWNYAYPTYQGASSGTATVQGPESSVSATHYAYESISSNRWRIGLESAHGTSDGIYSVMNVWTNYEFTDTSWSVLGVNMGKAKGPLVSSVTVSRTGDSSLRQSYEYLRTGVTRYGLPTKVSYFVNGSPSAKDYKELTYFYETHASFKDRYMLAFVDNEKHKSGAGAVLREIVTSYFEEAGKWGALKQIKRLKTGTSYYTWDFTYVSNGPTSFTIGVDAPGEGGVSHILYQYGIEQEVSTPDFLKYTRTISKYGYVLSEKNQYAGSRSYVYDNLGRTTAVKFRNAWEGEDPPDPFLTINYDWPSGQNQVVITQGGNTIVRYWDGMGRDTGYTESGDETTLYYLKTLDAEGRVKDENSGSINRDHKYSYLYDNAGRVTQVTDPVSNTTSISYEGHAKTLTDPKEHSTVYDYNDLPGLPTRLTDAQSHIAEYTYDAVGRLKTVDYLGQRQTYDYDGLDHITYEIHPETGRIDYSYDTGNRLMRKSWGGVEQIYVYNASGQLTSFTGAETVTYGYNEKGAVSSVAGSTGWSRSGIEYNDFGAVTHETILIPGLGSKSISYEYDANGNLTKTTYPDGREAVLGSNGLGRPESLTFNSGGGPTSIVDNASYGPNKMLAAMSVAGNGTTLGSTFYNNGTPNTVSLMRGSTPLYNATYSYDGAGNITGISSTTPAINATFAYDSLNRLSSATYSDGNAGTPRAYGYEYDAYGNMVNVRHDGVIAFHRSYDSNRISDPGYQYDSRGNLTSAEGKNYVWDAQNRLRAITDVSGQFVADYSYDDRGLRIASLPPAPDIDVVAYPTGSSADLTTSLNSSSYKTFTIRNLGHANLILNSIAPPSGQDGALFSISQQPSSPVLPNQSTTFTVRFLPTSTGDKLATLSIGSNDPDENPYSIILRGYCEPEINIGGVQGGAFDFGTVTVGESSREVFGIQNIGTATLLIYGAPDLEQSGGEYNFYLEEEGGPVPSEIPSNGSALFAIRFAPMSEGMKTATLTINSNDLNENPCVITLIGTGLNGPEKFNDESSLTILAPNGGEAFEAGTFQSIIWKGGDGVKAVKIEYSADNGSTYQTVIDRTPNTGTFPWRVPADLSGSCLIRISDADGTPTVPVFVSFEFNFRISAPEGDSPAASHFIFRAGLPDLRTQSYQVAEVAFAPDGLAGCENLLFNLAMERVQESERFFAGWHHARITYDMTDYTGSVWVDNEPVLSKVPLKADLDVQSPPEISLSRGRDLPVKLWIDDMDVRFLDQSLLGQDTTDVVFKPLFRDNFDKYETALFPRQGGWLLGLGQASDEERVRREAADESEQESKAASAEGTSVSPRVDDREYASSSKSFKLEESEGEPGTVVKRFSLPQRTPYCVSAENFAVIAPGHKGLAEGVGEVIRGQDGEKGSRRQKRWEAKTTDADRSRPIDRTQSETSRATPKSIRQKAAGGANASKMLAGTPVSGAFFVYAFDGRLLAEYDLLGQCIRDYIYVGGQLIAEYRESQAGHYLYYSSDQVNSTRIVTDSTGTVVYSAAHEPYGGIQKTWGVSTYDPPLKFSGKQRDAESGLVYFGGRYYNESIYRFLSVDPAPISYSSLYDPQRWNLYSYCGNNPVSIFDPDGRELVRVTFANIYFSKFFYSFLQSEMALKYRKIQDWADSNAITILVTDAFRTIKAHASLGVSNGTSLHEEGLAIDISYSALGKENYNAFKDFCDSIGLTTEIHGTHVHIYPNDEKVDPKKLEQAQKEANRLLRDPFLDMLRFLEFVNECNNWFIWGSMVPPDI